MQIKIRPEVQKIEQTMIEIRRDFHKHPELGFQEHRTATVIAEKLKSLGMEVKTGIGKTGVVADLKGNGGPTIALRADMDALPIQETGKSPYKSVNEGIMHACGHDGHMATLLGAAQVLADKRESLKGNVRFIFQPAEEGGHGAKFMIEDGCLEGVREIYGMHLSNYQNFGEIGVKTGPILAAADKFEIEIQGKGGHGATPQGTVDAIVVAAHLINTFQTIVSRNTNPLESAVVTIGKINGGSNFNVITDRVNLSGTARSYTEENRKMIVRRLEEIIAGTEQIFSAKINLDYQWGYAPTVNDPDPVAKFITAAKKIADHVEQPYLSMGGEDFSYYGQKIPACFFFVGSNPINRELHYTPHHCSHFDIEEKAMLVGASIFVQLVEDLFLR